MCDAPLLVTMGDPAGIGGELTLKAWRARRRADVPVFAALDDPDRLTRLAGRLGWDVPIVTLRDPAGAMESFSRVRRRRAVPIRPMPPPFLAASNARRICAAPAVLPAWSPIRFTRRR